MKNKTKSFLLLTATAATGMYIYNKYVSDIADEMDASSDKDGSYYSWKEGNIFYRTFGSGKPLLLVHDIDSASSSVEWQKIARKLSANHTVYVIDLLGCGKSDKPAINYTTYLYVQMITSFIKDVIGEKTDIVASNMSAPFVIMANQLDSDIIDKIVLVNPASITKVEMIPDEISKAKMLLINLPLVGTFIYNRLYSPIKLNMKFENSYYKNGQHATTAIKDAFYAGAHNQGSNGKYVFSSLIGNYMNQDMKHALKNINKDILIIASSDLNRNNKVISEYEKNKHFSSIYISGTNLYPHLERPEKIITILENKL